ncbi:hypothetical protein RO3G_02098 [Rhizopus delemar RA 99-880]|uniref:Sorting nexin-4 n=1 Tax=Rhizopus delemar (strain RA 99-880 / ATCC MYA-4621 / FGSC 9543 / NRRL 43880) TaxID=246409 RepID=I1BMG4_RHIO9|nr:hypothetical protein RO3G_02098 [Rhizopus delemar RA 99-880]|eukprot:EIE77394.1 hypothetical protein RO3G_02098 [Rhizopus delemar RA 99-880]
MSDDFENIIQWDVHTDTQTPQLEIKDPLSQFNEERLLSPSPTSLSSLNVDSKSADEPPASPHFSAPTAPLASNSNSKLPTITSHEKEDDNVEVLPMTILIEEPRKHNDPTQGTYVTYLVTTQTTLKTFKPTQPIHSTSKETDLRNDKRIQSTHIPPPTSLIGSIGDTLVNAFARLKKPDERFEEMKEVVNRLEDNLNTIERLYMRINKRQRDLQNDYTSFANSIQGLSALETNIKRTLHQFAETCKAYSKVMSEMSEKEELLFLNEIHELLAYCYAAKDVLKARDQKQLDFEELSRYLDQAALEKERILHPKFNDRANIAEYVTDKINEVRGISMQQARREKLSRLETKIKELQEEVTQANDESNKFSSQVVKEFGLFQKTKIMELKQGLLAYADCHIAFHEKGMSIWEKILPVLESMDSVKGDGEATV